jgi:hypothetical protein
MKAGAELRTTSAVRQKKMYSNKHEDCEGQPNNTRNAKWNLERDSEARTRENLHNPQTY